MTLLKSKYSFWEWTLFGIIFFSCSPWPFWMEYTVGLAFLYFFLIIAIFVLFNSGRLRKDAGVLYCFVLFSYFFLFQSVLKTSQYSSIFIVLAFLVAKNISPQEGKNVISLVTNYVFLSIIIPLPLWLIHQFITPIPVIGLIDVSSWKGTISDSPIYLNHFFFVSISGREAMRFYSWYDEPGVLGTLAAFLLWANQYNMRSFKILVIMFGAIFTFSIAFYILSLIGIIMQYFTSIKKMAIIGIAFIILGNGVYFILKDNLAFQQSIIYRIENFEDSGLKTRAIYETDKYWKSIHSSLDNQLIGLGAGTISISANYKNFIICYGFIGLIIVLMAYIILMGKYKKDAILTLLLFILSFTQRPQLFTAYNFILYAIIIKNFIFLKATRRTRYSMID